MTEKKTLWETLIAEYPYPDSIDCMFKALATEAEKRLAALESNEENAQRSLSDLWSRVDGTEERLAAVELELAKGEPPPRMFQEIIDNLKHESQESNYLLCTYRAAFAKLDGWKTTGEEQLIYTKNDSHLTLQLGDYTHSSIDARAAEIASGDNPSPVGDKTSPTDTSADCKRGCGRSLMECVCHRMPPTEAKAWNQLEASQRHAEIVREQQEKLFGKAWNPATDGFWAWCQQANTGISMLYFSEQERTFLISIGNCFQTREEAEDEGKWRFKTKLVYDEKIRQLKKNHPNEAHMCIDSFECGLMYGKPEKWIVTSPNPYGRAPFCPRAVYLNKYTEILGTDAKRYLTGEA
jgi:hypothetical protein